MNKIFSEEEIKSRLSSPDNLTTKLKHIVMERGRYNNAPEVPMEIRKVVAILGNEGEKTKNLVSTFDLGHETINSYRNGKISSGSEHSEELLEVIQDSRKDIEDAAIEALLESVQLIKPRLASETKVKNLSSVAKDLASVVESVRPKLSGPLAGVKHLHLYAPNQKQVEDYEILDI